MKKFWLAAALLLACPLSLFAGTAVTPVVFGIRMEFILFGLTLAGVAVFHHKTFEVAVTGLTILLLFKLGFTPFELLPHLRHEWHMLVNLFALLMGFAILARHFEMSRVPEWLSQWLPGDWRGPFALLVITFCMATFIDNIAAAMIVVAMADVVFRGKVHIGFLAAIVAAANAGGAFSVIGNTTSTMLWIDGVPALLVARAFLGSVVGLLTFGVFAARQQHRFQPAVLHGDASVAIDRWRLGVVVLIPVCAVVANVTLSFMGLGVWVAILLGALFVPTPWAECRRSFKGSLFLLALVLSASMMPVETLPHPSPHSTFVIGLISAVFDNIPLTKLTLVQGGYDWAFNAYCIGCGGSIIWFGSSAGVAVTNMFPEAKSVFTWLRHGWHVALGYVAGFVALLVFVGWQPYTHKLPAGLYEPEMKHPGGEQVISQPILKPLSPR